MEGGSRNHAHGCSTANHSLPAHGRRRCPAISEGYPASVPRGRGSWQLPGKRRRPRCSAGLFSTVPPFAPAQALDTFCHTVTVVFIDSALLDKAGDPMWDWLAECWTLTSASNGRHAMLAIAMDERTSWRMEVRDVTCQLSLRTVRQ
jgi:hypothetical protein